MEFIKLGKNYLIKNSNGKIVDEKTKLELENKELVLKDITGCNCQQETTKNIAKNKKRIKELENKELKDFQTKVWKKEFEKNMITAQTEEGVVADDIIEEADSIKE